MADEKRGAVYEEAAFKKENAKLTQPSNTTIAKNCLGIRSIPLRPGLTPMANSQPRTQSAPAMIFQMSKKPLMAPTRANALKDIRRSYLRQSPTEWTEFTAPEAEYFLANMHPEALMAVLDQEAAFRKEEKDKYAFCKPWEGMDHAVVDGEWDGSMDEALAAFKDENSTEVVT